MLHDFPVMKKRASPKSQYIFGNCELARAKIALLDALGVTKSCFSPKDLRVAADVLSSVEKPVAMQLLRGLFQIFLTRKPWRPCMMCSKFKRDYVNFSGQRSSSALARKTLA